eukprot:scaffold1201_cov199-Alexandrium_tamarense.AAC.22
MSEYIERTTPLILIVLHFDCSICRTSAMPLLIVMVVMQTVPVPPPTSRVCLPHVVAFSTATTAINDVFNSVVLFHSGVRPPSPRSKAFSDPSHFVLRDALTLCNADHTNSFQRTYHPSIHYNS